MSYIILALTHTSKDDSYITLWRPNNAGYCWSKENAGIYEDFIDGYHKNENHIPITVDEFDKMAGVFRTESGKTATCIPNNLSTRRLLGVKINQGFLIKKQS